MDAVYWLTSFCTARIAATPTVAFNNPHSTFITGDNLQRGNGATIHQKVEKVIICLAGTLIIFAFVETFPHMDLVEADEHPGIGALDGPVTGHLLE
ncbi:hypothetical protein [Enterobacter hormaechei]|nr:hypothetical protein [Enterobacter hormaechei]